MNEKVNIKKIAELAGVSVATVSRVINQNGRFSADTEARVKKIIEDCNYVPDGMAKGLRTSRTNTVGVIVPDIVSAHFARLVLEIEKELFKYSYSTVICNTNESKELEEKHVKTLVSQHVSGIIYISGNQHYSIAKDIPSIYIDRRPKDYKKHKNTIVIESDNENGGYLATKALLAQNCKRIAVMRVFRLDYNQEARYLGYCKAMQEANQTIDKSLILSTKNISIEAASQTIICALNQGLKFDGLMCTTDSLAIGAVLALKEMGKSVPEDVLVTGFDDIPITAIYSPSITTIHQDVVKMASEATSVILDMILHKEIKERHITIPVWVVERTSTAHAPMVDDWN
jgi:LacI family transcriptional regulator